LEHLITIREDVAPPRGKVAAIVMKLLLGARNNGAIQPTRGSAGAVTPCRCSGGSLR
jgi:hypothetical protein